MSTLTVRISQSSWKKLKTIAAKTDNPMQEVLDKAIEEYRRKCFLEEANKAFEALRNNESSWKEELTERKEWDNAIDDGLKEE